jgi:hypothetical protein
MATRYAQPKARRLKFSETTCALSTPVGSLCNRIDDGSGVCCTPNALSVHTSTLSAPGKLKLAALTKLVYAPLLSVSPPLQAEVVAGH